MKRQIVEAVGRATRHYPRHDEKPVNDPDYHCATDGRGNREVYLDGEKMEWVEAAHVREGWVVRLQTGPDGKPIVDENHNIVRLREYGKVEVKSVEE